MKKKDLVQLIVYICILNALSGCTALFKRTQYTPADVYDQAVSTIEKNYADEIKLDTSKKPDMDSLMVQLTHSDLITPKEIDIQRNPYKATTGIDVRLRGNRLEVLGVFKNSPADKAGITAGDRIVEIDGQPVEGISLRKTTILFQGPPGSAVTLKMMGIGNEIKTLKLVRENLIIEAVAGERFVDSGIGYIRMYYMDDNSPEKLKAAIKRLLHKGMKGLILDLRGNGGGSLQAINEISQLFLKPGSTLSEIVGKTPNKSRGSYSRGWSHYLDFPIVLLIDRNTESGAEILASTLKENERAYLIGENTSGDLVITSGYCLYDGSILLLKTHYVKTPKGNVIHGVGIKPDLEVRISNEELKELYSEVILNNIDNVNSSISDKQLDAAVSYLLKTTNPMVSEDSIQSSN